MITFMRKLLLLSLILFSTLSANATCCSDYLADLYSKEYNSKVKIVSKKEHIDKYEQKIGDNFVSSIVYGVGYMKRPKCKKLRITYICLLESCDKPPIWGYVIPR